jgi:hypothetical protein
MIGLRIFAIGFGADCDGAEMRLAWNLAAMPNPATRAGDPLGGGAALIAG